LEKANATMEVTIGRRPNGYFCFQGFVERLK